MGGSETYSGPYPFSEPETRSFRTLMERIKPHTFISIHSGDVSLFAPPAYTKVPDVDTAQLIGILEKVKKRSRCNCTVGELAQKIGYLSHGNCMDYAHDV